MRPDDRVASAATTHATATRLHACRHSLAQVSWVIRSQLSPAPTSSIAAPASAPQPVEPAHDDPGDDSRRDRGQAVPADQQPARGQHAPRRRAAPTRPGAQRGQRRPLAQRPPRPDARRRPGRRSSPTTPAPRASRKLALGAVLEAAPSPGRRPGPASPASIRRRAAARGAGRRPWRPSRRSRSAAAPGPRGPTAGAGRRSSAARRSRGVRRAGWRPTAAPRPASARACPPGTARSAWRALRWPTMPRAISSLPQASSGTLRPRISARVLARNDVCTTCPPICRSGPLPHGKARRCAGCGLSERPSNLMSLMPGVERHELLALDGERRLRLQDLQRERRDRPRLRQLAAALVVQRQVDAARAGAEPHQRGPRDRGGRVDLDLDLADRALVEELDLERLAVLGRAARSWPGRRRGPRSGPRRRRPAGRRR